MPLGPDSSPRLDQGNKQKYQEIMGSLIDLSTCTRWDVVNLSDELGTSHSFSGYVLMLGGRTLSRSIEEQSVIALSSCLSGFVSCARVGEDAVYVSNFLFEQSFRQLSTVQI